MDELPPKLISVHEALAKAGIPHAFGGAIALAYWTLDPRGTRDIDVNVFVSEDRAPELISALPEQVEVSTASRKTLVRDGQARFAWGGTPVDVFLSYDEIHDLAAEHRRRVPFGDIEIPVLGPVELAVFKGVFNRLKDWGDIASMIRAETLDVDAVRGHLERMFGPEDERFRKLDEAIAEADAAIERERGRKE